MNRKIYMRGGKETAEVIKALQVESLILDHNISDYGDNENHVYGISSDYQGKKLFISWIEIENNSYKEAGYTEVTPAQFYAIVSGKSWPSKQPVKEKAYCLGSTLFKAVLTKLVNNNICECNKNYLDFAKDTSTVWGYSQASNRGNKIGYSKNLDWFYNAGYSLVTPEVFYKIWSGEDWNKESIKPEKKYIGFKGSSDVNISLLPENIKNPKDLCGLAPCIYYVKNNVLDIVNESKEKELLEKIDVFDWIGFLTVLTASSQELDSISKRIKAFSTPGLCIPQPSILKTESSDCSKLVLPKKQTLKIVL